MKGSFFTEGISDQDVLSIKSFNRERRLTQNFKFKAIEWRCAVRPDR